MAVETADKQTCRVLGVCSEDFSPLARGESSAYLQTRLATHDKR